MGELLWGLRYWLAERAEAFAAVMDPDLVAERAKDAEAIKTLHDIARGKSESPQRDAYAALY